MGNGKLIDVNSKTVKLQVLVYKQYVFQASLLECGHIDQINLQTKLRTT